MNKLITINILIACLLEIQFSYGQKYDIKSYPKFDSLQASMTHFYENSTNFPKVDTQSLLIRAKLITLNRIGLIDERIIADEILKQNSEIYYFEDNPNMLYIFINHEQRYYYNDSENKLVYEFYSVGCTYVIGFNIADNSFFKLSGFSDPQLVEYKKALGSRLVIISNQYRKMYKLIKKFSICNCEFDESNRLYIY